MQNFASVFSHFALLLGFTEDDIATVNADAAALKWLAQNQMDTESFRRAAADYRLHATTGKSISNLGNFPIAPNTTPPAKISPGIYERLDRYVRRIRLAKNYSEAIGAQLNIIPTKPAALDLAEARPKGRLSALPGNIVQVSFVRKSATGVAIDIKLDKDKDWKNMGNFAKSPASLQIERGHEDLPRYVQVRLRYLVGNNAVGVYSDIDTIATIP